MNTTSFRRNRLARILKTSLKVIVIVAASTMVLCVIAAERLTVARRSLTQDTPQTYGMPYEEITLFAREDAVEVAAWYIPVDNQQIAQTPAIVMVHGWTASRTDAFNHHFLDMAQDLHKSGFAVLMIDLRGHGKSQASHVSFGTYERRDVLAAIDYLLLRGHPYGRIGLLGTSMGAASVIGAAAEHPAVDAVVTDSLFADVYPVIEGRWSQVSGIPIVFLHTTVAMFELIHGYDFTVSKPVEEIEQLADTQILLIHCQADSHIPLEQFQRLQEAAPWAQTWLVDECRHAEIYEFVPQDYSLKVVTFFETGLAQEHTASPVLEVNAENSSD